MKQLAIFVEKFMESDFMKAVDGYFRYRSSKQSLYDTIKHCLIIIGIVVAILLWGDIKNKYIERMMKKGTLKKECPIKEIKLSITNKRSFTLLFGIKTKKTRSAEEYEKARRENRQTKLDFLKAILSLISKDEVLLLDRYGSFRLDTEKSWEKKANEGWLSGFETVSNAEGYVIAIRGADEKIAECGYDIFVPKKEEKELSEMTVEELSRFRNEENCKLQIKENGSKIVFSDVEGYTKESMVEAIKCVAEEKEIKVKIDRRKK